MDEKYYNYIQESILSSQPCQRNWDLSKQIPKKDIDLILHSATQCPSKQNQNYYAIHVITDRELIQELYECSITPKGDRKNPQLLANVVLLFERAVPKLPVSYEELRVQALVGTKQDKIITDKDATISVGIAAGFVNLTSSLLGYQTGFCTCFAGEIVKSIFDIKGEPLLAIGIGIKNEEKEHYVDHDTSENITTHTKQKIDITYY